MVLTIAALDTAGTVDNWILGRADLLLRFSNGICCLVPTDCGRMCGVNIRSGADGDDCDCDGDGDSDGDGDGVGDSYSDHSIRSTQTSMLATSTSAPKLLQT